MSMKYSIIAYKADGSIVSELSQDIAEFSDAEELFNDYITSYLDYLEDYEVARLIVGNNETLTAELWQDFNWEENKIYA